MVGGHSMGPGLQLVGARFLNFLLGKLSREFKLRPVSIFHEIQMATYFGTASRYSHMVGHADSARRTVHISRYISSATFAWSSKLMVDIDSMGPGLQLVRGRFSNFLLQKVSHEV